jgi:hypothetical protein
MTTPTNKPEPEPGDPSFFILGELGKSKHDDHGYVDPDKEEERILRLWEDRQINDPKREEATTKIVRRDFLRNKRTHWMASCKRALYAERSDDQLYFEFIELPLEGRVKLKGGDKKVAFLDANDLMEIRKAKREQANASVEEANHIDSVVDALLPIIGSQTLGDICDNHGNLLFRADGEAAAA